MAWSYWIVHYKCKACGILVYIEKTIMDEHDDANDVYRFVSGKQKFHHCSNNENNFGVIEPSFIQKDIFYDKKTI